MVFALYGQAINPGVGIGRACLLVHATFDVAYQSIRPDQVSQELARLGSACDVVIQELNALLINDSLSMVQQELGAFVQLQRMILEDPLLIQAAKNKISVDLCCAEWALVQSTKGLVARFKALPDRYLRERCHDIEQVAERLLKALKGCCSMDSERIETEGGGLIAVAYHLSPVELLKLRWRGFSGFISAIGTTTSHSAVIARGLSVPAVFGVPIEAIVNRDWITLDGCRGVALVGEDPFLEQQYRQLWQSFAQEQSRLQSVCSKKTVTLDQVPVRLYANIDCPEEVKNLQRMGVQGVGLLRSEFLFLEREEVPSEAEQFLAFSRAVEAMRGLPVTIRLLDLGTDKLPAQLAAGLEKEENPALGLRAIRYCFSYPELFHTHLRAICRASVHGSIRILIPMLSCLDEVFQVRAAIKRACQSLYQEGLPFSDQILVGGMIETPSAAIGIRYFIKELDFISIGTNDLVQYVLAIDRAAKQVSYLYDPLHPAVLELIYRVVRTADRHQKEVSLCGEMGGNPLLTPVLLGLGLRCLSMPISSLLVVKQRLLNVNVSRMRKVIRHCLVTGCFDRLHEEVIAE